MAIETTPLGFKKPDGNEPVRGGNDVISDNAQKSQELLAADRARLALLEQSAGFPGDPVALADDVVSVLVTDTGSDTRGALNATFVPAVMLVGAGIDRTGVADSTAALQALIDAHPRRTLHLPAGVYSFLQLTLGDGQTLRGEGWQDYRDRFTLFGTAGWLVDSNFGGTVLRSTATTGDAITIVDSEVNGGGLADLILIGPGSGTSLGVMVGSPAMSVVHPVWRNVKVGNFAEGVKTTMLNEASFYDLSIHGCGVGLILSDNTNQNAFYMVDLQRNTTGCVIAGTSYANAFYSAVAQSNIGTGFIVGGVKNAFYNPYLENNAGGGIEIVSGAPDVGWGNAVHDPFCNNATDSIIIRGGATDCSILGYGWQGTIAPVINEANGTYLHGRFPNLTDTGYGTILIDYQKVGSPFSNWQDYTPELGGDWALGNGTATGKFTTIGRTVHFVGKFVFGSTSVFGAASPTVSLPYGNAGTLGLVQATITRTGVNAYTLNPKIASELVTMWATGENGALSLLTASFPATWQAGDSLEFSGTYERA